MFNFWSMLHGLKTVQYNKSFLQENIHLDQKHSLGSSFYKAFYRM